MVIMSFAKYILLAPTSVTFLSEPRLDCLFNGIKVGQKSLGNLLSHFLAPGLFWAAVGFSSIPTSLPLSPLLALQLANLGPVLFDMTRAVIFMNLATCALAERRPGRTTMTTRLTSSVRARKLQNWTVRLVRYKIFMPVAFSRNLSTAGLKLNGWDA